MSELAAIERTRARRRELLRWSRPAGFVLVAALLAVSVRTQPRPALHGDGLVALLGLAGIVACAALLLGARGRFGLGGVYALVAVLAVSSAALVWVEPNGIGYLGGFVAAGAVAARAPVRTGALVAGAALVLLTVAGLAGAARPAASVLVSGLGMVACYRLGWYTREMRRRTEDAEALAGELARTRDAQVRAAALAERQRLAREMHDVLAHSLSGLALHLEAARLLAARNAGDERLTGSLERARHLAEAGLREAREAVGMLRDEDLPGPERLAALARDFERDTGVPCAVETTGEVAELPARVRLTLYRVAQEALTNVRKHAKADRVTIRLAHAPDGVRLSIADFGAPAGPPATSGYGVSGMRERAELLGGTLTASPTEAGFEVGLWVPRE
ncbi:MAG TPA: histidine kinase [Actinophytocola sp.]|uniref:sensor histidine kinase n=1 Tax=Actinophytocola sp. TaxID=1872138 RepID=UPI002F95BDC4